MEAYKPLPIGIDDYKEIVQEGYYYVDKTLLIKELVDLKGKVNLFTRPRRFGKTLNLSMLRYFFEKGEEDRSSLFKGKKILEAGEAYTRHMGQYPVICLSLKSAKQPSFPLSYLSIKRAVSSEFKRHSYITGSLSDADKNRFLRIMAIQGDDGDYMDSVKFLSDCLYAYHKRKAVILMDEYDVPLENAYFSGFYQDMSGFLRSLFESALKSNPSMEFAVVTGCLRISRESIFTGLNNLNIVSILNNQYASQFGFTEAEVLLLLEEYGLLSRKEDFATWYDGYMFGKTTIYNPWSVLKFCYDLKTDLTAPPLPYWANTSSNSIVRKLVSGTDLSVREEIEALLSGKSISKAIHEDITYEDIDKSQDSLWNFLFFTGYLKKDGEGLLEDGTRYVSLTIPNKEVKLIYKNTILDWFDETLAGRSFSGLYHAIGAGDTNRMEHIIGENLMQTISMYDYAESFYHGFLAGLLKHMEGVIIQSNLEKGEGRPDILIRTPSIRGMAVILELKVSKSFEGMEGKCREALLQIKERKYAQGLLAEGYRTILSYGVAFYKKDCMVMKAGDIPSL